MPSSVKHFRLGRYLVYLASLAAVFLIGFSFGTKADRTVPAQIVPQVAAAIDRALDSRPTKEFKNADVDFDLFWKVKQIAADNYLRKPIDEKRMFYGSITGMVASLGDPYSVFFDPDTAKEFSAELSGTFDGIGAEIGIKSNQLMIVAPIPEMPAAKAGLRARDAILKIDGIDTTNMIVEDAVRRIKGVRGTTVKLLIGRVGWKEAKEFTVTRDQVVFKSVRGSVLSKNIGKIEIFQFNEETPTLFKDVVSDLLAKKVKGIILDMRNNPGGILNSAVEVAGEWLPNDVVVQEKDRNGVTDSLVAYGAGRLHGVPTVVLVNSGSASAAEIVAGALQDYKAAQLVGEQTFGKGSVQSLEDLGGGAQLKLTVAEWLTGKGRSIDQVGIAPDVKISMGKDDFSADRDPQLDKALELLK